ncbi:MAG: DUF411 domain-containing protein [Gemmatimonadota bacterium]|nr:DUF411 domain-containing protein [Gemmatimonadota bacterium]
MDRRKFLGSFTLATVGIAVVGRSARGAAGFGARSPLPPMTVYKTPTCGCCKDWIKHVEGSGFKVKPVDMDDLSPIKRSAGVPPAMESCHTALVGPYVVEGHVPADLVKKMLDEKPKVVGLSVPGMVVGSPGMEQGTVKQPYNVVAFTRDGKSSVYARR